MRTSIQIIFLGLACLSAPVEAQMAPGNARTHLRAPLKGDTPKNAARDRDRLNSDSNAGGQSTSSSCSTFAAQHPSAVQTVECGPWSTVAANMENGNWALFEVHAGQLYQWSICETNGGSANFAGRLSLWNEDGTVALDYSEDLCATNPRIRWTPPATQYVRVLLSKSDCRNGPGTLATLVWRCLGPPDIHVDATQLSFTCGRRVDDRPAGSSHGFERQGLLLGGAGFQFDDVVSEIQENGGKLLVRIEDRAAWLRLPSSYPEGAAELITSALSAHQRAFTTDDHLYRALGFSYADALTGATTARETDQFPLTDDALEAPEISPDDYLAHLQRLSLVELPDAAGREVLAMGTSGRRMAGSVTVALVFVESNGDIDPDTYTWTDVDEAATVAQAASGLAWWAARAQDHGVDLSFRVVVIPHTDPRAQQGYEPILHSSRDEPLWVRAVMANMGLPGEPFAAVSAFNTFLKSRYQSDEAFTAFFSYNPAPAPVQFSNGYAAWAYMGGPYTSLLFRSFGWNTMEVFAHETGHIFWACDEYYEEGYGGCLSCGSCAQGPANGNCLTCNPDSVPCIMRRNEEGLCSFTAAQLGWPEHAQSQCFDVSNSGDQNLTLSSIEHPSWIEFSPTLPLTVLSGTTRQLCGNVHCGSCQPGPLSGAITLHSNDPNADPTVLVDVDCTCAVARIACRCTPGEFYCEVYFPDSSHDGEETTIEVDGVLRRAKVNKGTVHFTGTVGDGAHRAMLVDPPCVDVSYDFSCGSP